MYATHMSYSYVGKMYPLPHIHSECVLYFLSRFAMKLLDKKRIKLKKGEALALNEKNMLAKVSSPFVVNLYYAFQTSDKLAFILDLMNGGDLHYHLTQHGVFTEDEVGGWGGKI